MTDIADLRLHIPPSVSPEAAEKLALIRAFMAGRPAAPLPETLEEFDAAAERSAIAAEQLTRAAVDALAPVLREGELGGTPILQVHPRNWTDDGSLIVYVHGGGFITGSARANLLTAALAAETSGRRVISVDYTLAPRGTWDIVTAQVAAVWGALLNEGADARKMGLFGDSAGGNIAAATALRLRDAGVATPAALVLLSPGVDMAGDGDTTTSLAHVDYLDPSLRPIVRRVYAPGADLTNPYISPINGDFTLGYPPTLFQVGTRETLLSDSVRLHRKLRDAGIASRLELYEGMPHVFQGLLADTPEGRAAWREMAEFWGEYLA